MITDRSNTSAAKLDKKLPIYINKLGNNELGFDRKTSRSYDGTTA